MNWITTTGQKNGLVFATLLLILLALYGNSFSSSFHFDDFDSIIINQNVHLKSLSWSDIKNTFYIRGKIVRPIAYLSFGLNYYLDGFNVFGYHVVNFIVHCVASLFLFLFIHKTLNLPILKKRYGQHPLVVAFLATVLWSVNPVQVSAVTYVVQRMSSMAGMFYIMAMYFYVATRTSVTQRGRIASFSAFLFAALLSLGTKENSVTLFIVLFLYDLFLIQGLSGYTIKKSLKIVIIPLLLILIYAALNTEWSTIIKGYETRPFSLQERLLTQPRVILFYITRLLYPIPSRLTFLYDVEISKSFFQPWETLPAIVVISLIVGIALAMARKSPLVSFCILFFFINHLIEGTIIPLEMVYEHRNYLPSLLLFVPVAIFIVRVYRYFAGRRFFQYAVIAAVVFVIADQGHTTYLRNEIWNSELSLWMDNVEKSPNLSRPHALLGKTLLNAGHHQMALDEFLKALQLKNWVNLVEPAVYQCYVGNFFMDVVHDDRKAEVHYEKSLQYSYTHEYFNGMAMVKLRRGKLAEAEDLVLQAIKIRPGLADYWNNYALILLKQGRLDEAIASSQKALELKRDYGSPNGIIAEAFHRKGMKTESITYWEKYLQREPERYYAYLALMDLYESTGDMAALEKTLRHLLERVGREKVLQIVRLVRERKNMFAHVPDPARIRYILEKTRPIENTSPQKGHHKKG